MGSSRDSDGRVPGAALGISELLLEAKRRWLKPAEVADILKNYKEYNFKLNQQPPLKPQNGALYLFNRKSVRYFRKDGHNWAKKNDGKTVKEAHEKLKAGHKDCIHCYYAHSADDDSFQRRVYWLLDSAREHIALVHYRQVTEAPRTRDATPPKHSKAQVEEVLPAFPQAYLAYSCHPESTTSVSSARSADNERGPPSPTSVVNTRSFPGSQLLQQMKGPGAVWLEPQSASFSVADMELASPTSGLLTSGAESFRMSDEQRARLAAAAPGEEGHLDVGALLTDVSPPTLDPITLADNPAMSRGWPAFPKEEPVDHFQQLEPQHHQMQPGGAHMYLEPAATLQETPTQDLSSLPANHVSPWVGNSAVSGVAGGKGMFGWPSTVPNANLTDTSAAGSSAPASANFYNVPPHDSAAQAHLIETALQEPSPTWSNSPLWPVAQSWASSSSLLPSQQGIHLEPFLLPPAQLPLDKPAEIGWQHADLRSQSEMVKRSRNDSSDWTDQIWGMTPRPSDEAKETWDAFANGEPLQGEETRTWSQTHAQLKQPTDAEDMQQHSSRDINGKPPLPPSTSLLRLRNLKKPTSLAVDSSPKGPSGEAGPSGQGLQSPFSVPQSPTVVQVLREMHTDAVSNMAPASSAGSSSLAGHEDEEDEVAADIVSEQLVDNKAATKGHTQEEERLVERASQVALSMQGEAPRFEILDCAPDWDFSAGGAKVMVVCSSNHSVSSTEESFTCTFGGLEVPAEVVAPNVLRCVAPAHMPGRVTFGISSGDGLVCSNLREFEYRPSPVAYISNRNFSIADAMEADDDSTLQVRLARALLEEVTPVLPNATWQDHPKEDLGEEGGGQDEKEWGEVFRTERASGCVQDGLLQMLLKRLLKKWVAAKKEQSEDFLCEEVEIPVEKLDEGGLGVIHLAAALGYDWAIGPLVEAGVRVDTEDLRGRTALHWAAARGREQVVAELLAAGAAPGMLTARAGCTPADLAAACGHTGIAAYLAEMALNRSLSNMTINEQTVDVVMATNAAAAGDAAVAAAASATVGVLPTPGDQTLANALEAVRSAASAAALIQSADRKRRHRQALANKGLTGLSSAEGSSKEEDACLAMAAEAAKKIQTAFRGHQRKKALEDLAAKRIQAAFRSYCDRREYLSLRQRIVRIQAAVRGQLQRKRYQTFKRPPSPLDSTVAHWRLRNVGKGPRSSISPSGSSLGLLEEASPEKEEIKEKEEEWRNVGGSDSKYALEKAVTRVQAMVRSRQARQQYLRLRQAALNLQADYAYKSTLRPQSISSSFNTMAGPSEAAILDIPYLQV